MYEVEVKYAAPAGLAAYPNCVHTMAEVKTHVVRALAAWGRFAPADLADLEAFELRFDEEPEYFHEDLAQGVSVRIRRLPS